MFTKFFLKYDPSGVEKKKKLQKLDDQSQSTCRI